MEQVKRLMAIVDKYSDDMSNNDYLQACNLLHYLHNYVHTHRPKMSLTINKKMRILLHNIDQINPDMVPIFTTPYTHSQIEYAEWLANELNIDVDRIYAQAREQFTSSHAMFL